MIIDYINYKRDYTRTLNIIYMKRTPLYLFELNKGKWKIRLNGVYLAWIYQTHGIPIEMQLEEIDKWTPQEKIVAMFNSWKIQYDSRIYKNTK